MFSNPRTTLYRVSPHLATVIPHEAQGQNTLLRFIKRNRNNRSRLVTKVKYWSLPIQQAKQKGGHIDWVNSMKVKDQSLPISVN